MFEWIKSRFSLGEVSGSLGDLATLLPITLSMAKKGLLNIGTTFVWGGLFNIIGGIMWDMPIPVQPMKTIGSVAINGGLTTPGSVSAAGILTGAIVSVLGYFQIIQKIALSVPPVLIGIIQVGTGLKFSINGITQISKLTNWIGYDSYLMAIISAVIVCLNFCKTPFSKYIPSALILFILGLILSGLQTSISSYSVYNPFYVVSFTNSDWQEGFIKGTIPQVPLTILNSIIGITDLSISLFGQEKGLTIKESSLSLGFINLVGCPFGAIPSCHGAGGLSGQYKFGGRNGLSVIMIGVFKILVGIFCGSLLIELLNYFPSSILGVMLAICGAELSMQGLKRVKSHRTIFILGLTVALVFELWIGFLAGLILYLLKFDEDEIEVTQPQCVEIQSCC